MSLDDFKAFVESVREANPLADVVGADADLRRRGRGLYCKSPLRPGDRNPSFVVFDDNDSWYDFGSNEGGDVFDYVMRRDRCEFRDAVDALAERVGLEWTGGKAGGEFIDDATREEVEKLLERRWVVDLIDEAADYYHRSLPRAMRAFVREHYGFDDETIDRAKIGWATGALFHWLTDVCDIDEKKLAKTGLFVKRRDGTLVDFFDRRIVFPYLVDGRACYMIGRRVDGHTPDDDFERGKYKKQLTHNERHAYVSKYVDNSVLYGGGDRVRGRGELLLITEGVTDAISAQQAGFDVRSPVTTRFRKADADRFVDVCKRFDRVAICNDAEESGAGLEGALAMSASLFAAGVDVRIAELPRPDGVDKVDVNSYLRDHDADALRAVVAHAKRYPEFLLDRIPKSAPTDVAERELRIVYEVVGALGVTEREMYIDKIARRFRIPKRIVRAEVGEHVDESDTPTIERLHGQVQEDENGFYFVRAGDESIILSTFSLRMRERIVDEDGSELACCDVHTARGGVIPRVVFPRHAWTSKREFLRALPSVDLQWTGSDDNVQGVLKILSEREVPRTRGVRALGYLWDERDSRAVYVLPDRVLGAEGVIEDSDLRWVGHGTIGDRLDFELHDEAETRALAKRVLPAVLSLNDPAVMVGLIGWFYGSTVAPWVRARLGHYPIGWLFGTQGSGKTTLLRDVMWPLVGVAHGRDPFSVTDTMFTQIATLASTTSVPIVVDEYKLDAGKYALDRIGRLARRVYGGEIEQRGRSDQSVRSYRLVAPMIVAGEMLPTDPAIIERIVCVSPLKTALTPERARTLSRLAAEPLSALAGSWVRFVLGRRLEDDLAAARKVLAEIVETCGFEALGPRILDNLLVVVFGVMLFEAWAESLGVELPEFDAPEAFREMVRNLLDSTDISAGGRDNFDRLFESLSTYAQAGVLREGTHFAVVDSKLFLHLASCYEVYLAERKRTGQHDETNGMSAIRRVLREKIAKGGYVLDASAQVRLSEFRPRVRCVKIDPELVPEEFDVEPFPTDRDRPWGGSRWGGSGDWRGAEN